VRDLAALTAADFDPLVDTTFAVVADGVPAIELALRDVARGSGLSGFREPFALTFSGPPEPVLEFATYRLAHADFGEFELFLGPVVSTHPGISYEAVFA
jgi:hypothetical protein